MSTTVSEEELKEMIRTQLPIFEAKVASGEIKIRNLTYSRPRGPVIVPWPPGWGVTAKQRGGE